MSVDHLADEAWEGQGAVDENGMVAAVVFDDEWLLAPPTPLSPPSSFLGAADGALPLLVPPPAAPEPEPAPVPAPDRSESEEARRKRSRSHARLVCDRRRRNEESGMMEELREMLEGDAAAAEGDLKRRRTARPKKKDVIAEALSVVRALRLHLAASDPASRARRLPDALDALLRRSAAAEAFRTSLEMPLPGAFGAYRVVALLDGPSGATVITAISHELVRGLGCADAARLVGKNFYDACRGLFLERRDERACRNVDTVLQHPGSRRARRQFMELLQASGTGAPVGFSGLPTVSYEGAVTAKVGRARIVHGSRDGRDARMLEVVFNYAMSCPALEHAAVTAT